MSRDFIDTNVFVYASDRSAGDKRRIAQELVTSAFADDAAISPQVLQEYFVVATRKLGLPEAIAQQHVRYMAELDQAVIDANVVLRAIDCHRLNALSYWDALIVTCAADKGCSRLLSEDMQHGQTIAGVLIENPFR